MMNFKMIEAEWRIKMYLFDLGYMPNQYSMLIFHALARLEMEALVIVSPQDTLVSVGYFQNLEGVDLDFCEKNGISVMRREIGGGTTLLDSNQIFYQVILKKSNPQLPPSIEQLYQDYSQPVIDTYKHFGINTKFKPINDIVTLEGRKISGEGGGDIGNCQVFVGGILNDFNTDLMSKVLKVPDEKFRDKIFRTMEENLTTVKKELGMIPPRKEVIEVLTANFSKILGPLEALQLPEEVLIEADKIKKYFMSASFLYKNTRKEDQLKINADVSIRQGLYKAPGGLIKAIVSIHEEQIDDVQIVGDFTLYPKKYHQELESSLRGVRYEYETVLNKINDFFTTYKIELPGILPSDLCNCIFQYSRKSSCRTKQQVYTQ